jgi:mannose-1-phosphate guanylyltransferase
MLEWTLRHLAHHGVTDVTLALGYLPDPFKAAYPYNSFEGVRLHYSVEPEPLDTGGAIRFAAKASNIDSTFIVLNGDMVTDLDLSALVHFHGAHDALATIALQEVEDPSAFGIVVTDDDGLVTGFVEKPSREEAPSTTASTGIYVFEPAVLDLIDEGRVSIERVTFPALVARSELFAAMATHPASDAGTPAGYLNAHFDLIDGRRTIDLTTQAHRSDDHWQEEGVTISGSASNNSYLGSHSNVALHASVKHSVLGRNVVVAEGAIIEDSVILDGATIASGAKVSHSIVGAGANIGSHAHVADLSVIGEDSLVNALEYLQSTRHPSNSQD